MPRNSVQPHAPVLRYTLAVLLSFGAATAFPAAPATAATEAGALAQADAALTALFDRYDKATLARSPTAKAGRKLFGLSSAMP